MKKLGGIRRFLLLLLALLCLTALTGCALLNRDDGEEDESAAELEENPEYPATAGGVTLEARPGKVISLAPSLTEKLVDLGLSDRLVGVSDYCGELLDRPLPALGTAALPDLEGILALAPHLVLSADALPAAALEALEEAGIPVAVLPATRELSGVYGAYRDLAVLLEGRETGAAVGEGCAGRFRDRLATLTAAVAAASDGQSSVLYLRLADFTVATRDSVEHQLLEAAGLLNIAGDYTGWQYPEKAARETARPDFEALDLILLDRQAVTIADLERSDFYSALPAVRQDRCLYIDAAAFERQGMGMLDQLERIIRHLYPEAEALLGPSTLPDIPEEAAESNEEEPEPAGESGDVDEASQD